VNDTRHSRFWARPFRLVSEDACLHGRRCDIFRRHPRDQVSAAAVVGSVRPVRGPASLPPRAIALPPVRGPMAGQPQAPASPGPTEVGPGVGPTHPREPTGVVSPPFPDPSDRGPSVRSGARVCVLRYYPSGDG